MKKNKQGFTALELLMVIAVISVLAAMLLSGVTEANKRARTSKTKALIESLTIACSTYRNDYYVYPPSAIPSVAGETAIESLYYYLGSNFVAGENSGINSGPYFEFRARDKSATGRSADMNGDGDTSDNADDLYEIRDPWGNSLSFTSPGTNNTNSIDIYSFGPDGTDDSGGGDDITNWH